MALDLSIYVEDEPVFSIKNGVVRMHFKCSAGEGDMYFPLCRFRVGHGRVKKMLAAHDAAGEVIPFTRPDESGMGGGRRH